MVINVPLKCDTCGSLIRLKIQCDDSLYNYDFPLHIYCQKCGDEFDCRYTLKNGILPKKYKGDVEAQSDFALSYSPQLPIPRMDFYNKDEKLVISPFILLMMSYGPDVKRKHGNRIKMVLENIYPYRMVLSELIPVMRKGNFAAFQKKMMNVFDIKKANRNILSISECRDVFAEFVEKIHTNFASSDYMNLVAQGVIDICDEFVERHAKDELREFTQNMGPVINLSHWIKETEDFLGQFLMQSEKYYPAMFFSNVGDFSLPHACETIIETIDVDDVHNHYKKAFDLLGSIIPMIVAICNWKTTGGVNTFPNANGGMKGITDIKMFNDLPDGLKNEKLQDYTLVAEYLAGCYNTHVRNALAHNNVEIDPLTQIVEYYYRMNDNETHDDYMLIDVCHMSFINVLHLQELYLVVHKIKSKIE